MHNPVEVQIAISRPPESIRQMAVDIYEPQKDEFLKLLLKNCNLKKVIVFVGKKQRVKELARALRSMHIDARAMHSDLEQKERDEVMLDFRNGKVDVLVATDIVSRGIDVDDVPLVINYDVPRDAEDYVHRIGRTARAENKGEAITLVSPEELLLLWLPPWNLGSFWIPRVPRSWWVRAICCLLPSVPVSPCVSRAALSATARWRR